MIPSKWVCFLVEKRTRNSSRIVLSLTIRSIPLYSTTEIVFIFFLGTLTCATNPRYYGLLHAFQITLTTSATYLCE